MAAALREDPLEFDVIPAWQSVEVRCVAGQRKDHLIANIGGLSQEPRTVQKKPSAWGIGLQFGLRASLGKIGSVPNSVGCFRLSAEVCLLIEHMTGIGPEPVVHTFDLVRHLRSLIDSAGARGLDGSGPRLHKMANLSKSTSHDSTGLAASGAKAQYVVSLPQFSADRR